MPSQTPKPIEFRSIRSSSFLHRGKQLRKRHLENCLRIRVTRHFPLFRGSSISEVLSRSNWEALRLIQETFANIVRQIVLLIPRAPNVFEQKAGCYTVWRDKTRGSHTDDTKLMPSRCVTDRFKSGVIPLLTAKVSRLWFHFKPNALRSLSVCCEDLLGQDGRQLRCRVDAVHQIWYIAVKLG